MDVDMVRNIVHILLFARVSASLDGLTLVPAEGLSGKPSSPVTEH